MRLRLITLLFGAVLLFARTYGQDQFTFQNQLSDTVHFEIEMSEVGNHYLGEQLAVKLYRIKETYTYVEAGTETTPGNRTVIVKPAIYYSLKKLNNHFKKQLKKGMIDSSTAVTQLGWFMDIGFAIYGQDTTEFEKALKSAKKPDEIVKLFNQVTLI
jgi:hypothetical protein